jgi:uncharacterized small protein (DUF1192 family)
LPLTFKGSERLAALLTSAVEAARLSRRGANMVNVEPDDLPKRKIAHEIGQDLSLLSVAELAARVGLLKAEIGRLEAEMTTKQASRSAADTFFKK